MTSSENLTYALVQIEQVVWLVPIFFLAGEEEFIYKKHWRGRAEVDI